MKLINKIEQGIINTPSYLKTNLNKFRDRLGEKGLRRFKNASFAIISGVNIVFPIFFSLLYFSFFL